MGSNPNGWLEDISNNLDEMRKELRLSNQLKLYELRRGHELGIPVELAQMYAKIYAKLTGVK